ncbi:MAG TPA: hypothetical protein VHE35_17065 [Kofleriaceae bacterium]|nr:hypothetical protein [Kofleriaceae bacterium]
MPFKLWLAGVRRTTSHVALGMGGAGDGIIIALSDGTVTPPLVSIGEPSVEDEAFSVAVPVAGRNVYNLPGDRDRIRFDEVIAAWCGVHSWRQT